jgi:hypothetical protein
MASNKKPGIKARAVDSWQFKAGMVALQPRSISRLEDYLRVENNN